MSHSHTCGQSRDSLANYNRPELEYDPTFYQIRHPTLCSADDIIEVNTAVQKFMTSSILPMMGHFITDTHNGSVILSFLEEVSDNLDGLDNSSEVMREHLLLHLRDGFDVYLGTSEDAKILEETIWIERSDLKSHKPKTVYPVSK
jgi:hypothetical protein